MTQIIIPQNCHRSRGLRPQFLYKPKLMIIRAVFNESIFQVLPTIDSLDWNKLAGFSRGWHNPAFAPLGAEINSYRIGWRYNRHNERIEFAPYQYNSGQRISVGTSLPEDYTGNAPEIIASYSVESFKLRIEKKRAVKFTIELFDNVAVYNGPNKGSFLKVSQNLPSWGYRCNPFHGGNLPAVEDLTFEIQTFIEAKFKI